MYGGDFYEVNYLINLTFLPQISAEFQLDIERTEFEVFSFDAAIELAPILKGSDINIY